LTATHSVQYDIRHGDQRWSVEMQLPISDPDDLLEERESDVWIQLGFNQCAHCQLTQSRLCPVANAIDYHAKDLDGWLSHDDVAVTVKLNGGVVSNMRTSAQQVLSSILGIIVASEAACEHTRILLPMVYFHRPFATQDESIYRALANAALIYQLSHGQGSFADFVIKKYEAIAKLNMGLVRRLQSAHPEREAQINALINLDTFAKGILFHARHEFKTLENLNLLFADDLS
jgi:hypothetical protein